MNIRLVKSAEKTREFDSTARSQTLQHLKAALGDLFRLRHAGVSYAEVARAQGLADGYMKCVLDLGLATEREMLALVAEVRRGVDGPATTLVARAGSLDDARATA